MDTQQTQSFIAENPFTPVFGKVPPYFAGREHVISDIIAALEHPQNSPDRCSIFVGARGTGKTALLTYFAHEAETRGWISANVTASAGMLDDVLQCAVREATHLIEQKPSRRLTGISVAPLGGIEWENTPDVPANWRDHMSRLLDELAQKEVGLLITVDEVDPSLDEMAQLVTTYQHFVREDRNVVLLMAGLPHRVSALLNGSSTSFLRRAAQHNLGPIPRYEVEQAFRLTVAEGGRSIDEVATQLAVQAIDGFPFMFQLVGYRSWNASADSRQLTKNDVEQGVRLAKEELEDRVFGATLAELSPGDIAFLTAMASLPHPTLQSDIRKKLGKSTSHVSIYKRRLLEAGVIEEPRRGTLIFALPGFGEYVTRLP